MERTETNRVELEYGTMWLTEEGILRGVYKSGVRMTLALAHDANARLIELSGGLPRPCLFDVRLLASMDREARAFFAEAVDAFAVALLIESVLSRIIANFFLGLNRNPKIPTRLFTDETEALEWLKGYR